MDKKGGKKPRGVWGLRVAREDRDTEGSEPALTSSGFGVRGWQVGSARRTESGAGLCESEGRRTAGVCWAGCTEANLALPETWFMARTPSRGPGDGGEVSGASGLHYTAGVLRD